MNGIIRRRTRALMWLSTHGLSDADTLLLFRVLVYWPDRVRLFLWPRA